MNDQKQQVSERIKQANNILVTVSNNPSVDQLAACIGLTIALNKMGKHATAVFSGAVPSTIEFLQPEKTIEKNTDSLRDFIIALDKSKADKLRYKVEDKVVKIFITPYRTSINERDLEFSQGDFNVDVVVALGVHDQNDLDQAITAHGRILHDATVMSVNVKPGGELGSINWVDPAASSLSELATQIVDLLDKKLVDNQIATALLTGIVAETNRFSNAKTSPQTMGISAELMAAGANQQLVATKLEEPPTPPPAPLAAEPAPKPEAEAAKSDDGTLEITHDESKAAEAEKSAESDQKNEEKPEEPAKEPEPAPEPKPEEKEEPEPPQIHIDEHGSLESAKNPKEKHDNDTDLLPPEPKPPKPVHSHDEGPRLVLQPPTFDSQLTASTAPTGFPSENSMSLPEVEPNEPLLNREPLQKPSVGPTITPPGEKSHPKKDTEDTKAKASKTPDFTPPTLPELSDLPPVTTMPPAPAAPTMPPLPPEPPKPAVPPATLSDIERNVHSPHLEPTPPQPAPALTPPLAMDTPPTPASTDMVTPTLPGPDNPSTEQDLHNARDAVNQAIGGSNTQLDPIAALNAQSLGGPLHATGVQPPAPSAPLGDINAPTAPPAPSVPVTPPANPNGELSLPGVSNVSFSPSPTGPTSPTQSPANEGIIPNNGGPGAPPPVPPPMLPPVPPAQP